MFGNAGSSSCGPDRASVSDSFDIVRDLSASIKDEIRSLVVCRSDNFGGFNLNFIIDDMVL